LRLRNDFFGEVPGALSGSVDLFGRIENVDENEAVVVENQAQVEKGLLKFVA